MGCGSSKTSVSEQVAPEPEPTEEPRPPPETEQSPAGLQQEAAAEQQPEDISAFDDGDQDQYNNSARHSPESSGSSPERRIDPEDGEAYTKAEFAECYGGYEEWDAAVPEERWGEPALQTTASVTHDEYDAEGAGSDDEFAEEVAALQAKKRKRMQAERAALAQLEAELAAKSETGEARRARRQREAEHKEKQEVISYFLVFVPTIREIRDFYREM
eukprot:SAG31_NODE_220_length_19925_cov_3.630939_20_plen_216_part_00